MRKLIFIALIVLVTGCLPATKQEVQTLTSAVKLIVPAVREAVSTESAETRGKVEVVLGQVSEINEAMATTDDPVDAVETGWKATEAWNP